LGSRRPPLGPHRCSCCDADGQGPGAVDSHLGRRFGCRRCLLKGCERWFRPCRPQSCYCSVACQQAARRWQRWYASRRWRSSPQGQERRREQSRRYRQRWRERQQALQLSNVRPVRPREGQRPGEDPQKNGDQPCRRPGCYELFEFKSRSPQQQFCSCQCRQALRRVRQREVCRHARRRLRQRQRRRAGRGPP
jgi:hypothetical protein